MQKHYFEQSKGKSEVHPTCKGKPKWRFDMRRSGFKPPFKNQPRNFQQGQQAWNAIKMTLAVEKWTKGPL